MIGAFDFLGDDFDAAGDDGFVLGVADAEAFVGVGPGLGQAGEEVVARDNDDPAWALKLCVTNNMKTRDAVSS